MNSTPLISPIETLDALVLTAIEPKFIQNITGEFVWVLSADEEFDVFLNKATKGFRMGINDFFRMPAPDGVQSVFSSIEIRRKAGAVVAANTVVLILGSGDYKRGSTVVSLAVGQSIRETPASTLSGATADVVLVAATNAVLIAANLSRRCVRITNTGVVDARISSVAADLTAGRGELVRAGETREIFVTGAISARSAGTPTLNIGEEIF